MSSETSKRNQLEYNALDDDERAMYDEATNCGATHSDAMEAATTLGYSRSESTARTARLERFYADRGM